MTSETEVALRRIYNKFHSQEILARSRARHPAHANDPIYVGKMEMEAATWAMAADLIKEEMVNERA